MTAPTPKTITRPRPGPRRLLRLATALICLPLFYLAASLLGAVVPAKITAQPAGDAVTVGLMRGPLHYDFLLPLTDELRAQYHFAATAGVPIRHPDAEWLVVGWGAAQFYTSVGDYADLSASAIWRGVSGDAAVMHLDAAGRLGPLPGMTALRLSPAQYAALLDQIASSFQRDQTGAVIPIAGAGLGTHDAFFAAKGNFNLFHTCNVWVGEMLRAAGVPFGAWTPTPQSVALALDWHLPD